jgi:hypothetical protein
MAKKMEFIMEKSKFRIFPSERMSVNFPWQVWAVGWLCIFKGIIWLAYEPNMSANLLSLGMLPLIICGIGIWNLRKWAVWGAVAFCAVNLIIFFFTPQAFSAMVVKSEVIIWSILLSTVTLLCNGPLGDLLVILVAPTFLRHTKKG